jgi:hypothetical protein
MKLPTVNGKTKRYLILAVAILGLATLFLLAAGLSTVNFKPAEHYVMPGETQAPAGVNNALREISSMSLGEAIMLVGGSVILIILFLSLLSPEARKRLLKAMLRYGLTAYAIYWAVTKFHPMGALELDQLAQQGQQTAQDFGTIPTFTPPVIPPWLTYAVGLLIFLILGGIGYLVWHFLRPPQRELRNLARITRSALDDLSAGRDWEDTVIQCYARMSAAVSRQRGLSRQRAMTPNEFALHLVQAGLPADPVRRLTRLFERARYGGRQSSTDEANEAIACLSSIVQAVEG